MRLVVSTPSSLWPMNSHSLIWCWRCSCLEGPSSFPGQLDFPEYRLAQRTRHISVGQENGSLGVPEETNQAEAGHYMNSNSS